MSTSQSKAPHIIAHPPRPVDVAAIERELIQVWDEFRDGANDKQAIMRACMSNLMIFCSTEQQATEVAAEIPTIAQLHPARVILLVKKDAHKDAPIEASVSAFCRQLGSGRQVCSEHIRIEANDSNWRHLSPVARSLLIGDLPTTLWWFEHQPPVIQGKLFNELIKMADQLVYDSIGWPNPAEGILAMTRWVSGDGHTNQVVYNLAWRRMRPWRRLIAEALAPEVVPNALDSINDITIEHGPHALPMIWLLIGWMATRLGWQLIKGKLVSGSEISWHFKSGSRALQVCLHRMDSGEPEMQRLMIRWQGDGAPGHANFAKLDAHRMGIVAESSTIPPSVISISHESSATMVARQLAHRERDPLFTNTLEVSRSMAEVLHL